MAGQSGRFVRRLERQMAEAAEAQDYERAARLRDDIGALTRAIEKQAVVLADGTDADVVGVAEDQLEAAVQVFHVRGGRVRGQRGYVVDKVEELTTGELVGQFLAQAYGDEPDPEVEVDRRMVPGAGVTVRGADDVPREVLVPALPPDLDVLHDRGCATCAAPTCRSACRSGATSARCWRPWSATPRRPSRCTRPSAPAT